MGTIKNNTALLSLKTDPTASILVAKDSVAIANPSLFREHLLVPQSKFPKIHFTKYDYGFFLVVFLLYALYVWLYVYNRKRLNQIVKGFYINRYANQLARDEITLGNRVSLFLGFLFVITLTIFIMEINKYYGYRSANTFAHFAIISLVIVLSYTIKLILIKWLGFLFMVNKETAEYRMSIYLFGNVLGLFMFPVVICLLFAKQISPEIFIYAGIVIIILFLLIRLVRGIAIGLGNPRISKFYLFLYLCTLEILPFVIGVKLFMMTIIK